ncbi:MAG: glycosyltransferase family 87 protein, partial [Propionibacteriaceae bacterium]|nr:glycosyltransferase family 87 protein [Propionibacteriaceae bacterium]
MKAVKRVALIVLYAIPPIFAAFYAGATEIKDGQFVPWQVHMIDLDVYRRAALELLAGQDFYLTAKDAYPFIYPPFAALLSLPLAIFTRGQSEFFWMIVNAVVVMALVHRLGFKGWRLSIVATAAIWLVQPMRQTLGFGQVNILLMALVVLDLMPGPRLLGERRRLLPEGWLTGIATAIKLTPAIF